MGEAIPMDAALGLREADDPFRADVVRWKTLDVPSIMVEEDLTKLREVYRIPADIELMIPGPNERACFSRRGCTALHLNSFVSGMRLPLHPMFRMILRAYGMAPTQVAPKWKESNGRGHVLVVSALLWHENAFVFVPNHLPAEEVAEEEGQGGGSGVRVHDDPEPDLDVSSFYGIANTLPRYELSKDVVDIVRSIYQEALLTRSYGLLLNRHRCLVELSLMASKAEMDQGRRPWLTLARLLKQRPKVLVPSSADDTSQRKVIEDLSREGNRTEVAASDVVEIEDTGVPEGEVPLKMKRKDGASESGPSQSKKKVELVDNYTVCATQPFQRTLSVNPSGEVVLDSPPRADPVSGGLGVGPFDSRKKLRELIEHPRSKISDNTLRNVPFFPSMGAQDVKKYFTPKWKEFTSHGELEDMLEASLATAVRVTSLQMKVLGEFRTRMQEHKKLVAEASKSDKEHQQSLEGLQLDTANVAQKVVAEALEAANLEKRCFLSESECRDLEFQRMREELEVSEKGRMEAEAEVTRLLGEKKEMEVKLENVEADFIANFHNTEAYTNFSDYFARVGHQEVLAALRTERNDLDLGPLGDRFPPLRG
ncbi:Uncharacterized protein Adt_29871 [Abeliophyllum distichum]|uniref:Uncharacterized protein n=1 Tax=Abeliophyllum distichum TaxID=126358 RepID=A0ABD1R9L7_9LAMI